MAWAFAQDDTAVNDTGTSIASLAKAFTSNVTTGNHIFVGVGWGDNDQIPTISDSLGNTYTLIRKTWFVARTQGHATYYAQNVTGGACTVTASLSPSSPYVRLYVRETSGLATSASLDVEAGQAQVEPGLGANAVTSGAMTTTVANTCLIGWTQDVAGTQTSYTAGTSFTLRESVAGLVAGSEDRNCASAGSFAATFTISANHDHITHGAAFKEAAAAAVFIFPQRIYQRAL